MYVNSFFDNAGLREVIGKILEDARSPIDFL